MDQRIAEHAPDLIFMDGALKNDDWGGLLVEQLRAKGISTPIIMISSSDHGNQLGMNAGANATLPKGRGMMEGVRPLLERFGFLK